MRWNNQDCGSGGLHWGLWEFPDAWLSEGSQLFIGHLWPFLQVWRGLLGELSWLEQKWLCFPWQSWLSPAVSSGGISGGGMSHAELICSGWCLGDGWLWKNLNFHLHVSENFPHFLWGEGYLNIVKLQTDFWPVLTQSKAPAAGSGAEPFLGPAQGWALDYV